VRAAVVPKRRFLQEPHGVHIPEDTILHSHRRENLKSYIATFSFFHSTATLQRASIRLWTVETENHMIGFHEI
jgi:hypothetical protein